MKQETTVWVPGSMQWIGYDFGARDVSELRITAEEVAIPVEPGSGACRYWRVVPTRHGPRLRGANQPELLLLRGERWAESEGPIHWRRHKRLMRKAGKR